MRRYCWLLLAPALFVLVIGCKSDDLVRPKAKGAGGKGGGGGPADAMDPMNPMNMPGGVGQPPPPGGNNPGGDTLVKKNPKSLLGNVGSQADLIKEKQEMEQIVILFNAYCGQNANVGSRTVDGFLDFIKTDSAILKKIKNKYYTMNVKAKLSSNSIIVYVTEPYTKGYSCARANGFIGFVSAQEQKAGLAP